MKNTAVLMDYLVDRNAELVDQVEALEDALRKIKAEVGTSTLAWKIASDALLDSPELTTTQRD